MKKPCRVTFIVLIIFGILGPSVQADPAPLKIVYISFPPFGIDPIESNGQPGLVVDLIKLALDKQKIPYEVRAYPYQRIKYLLDSGKDIDIFTFAEFQKEHYRDFIFSDRLIVLSLTLFQNVKAKPLSSIGDLKGERIISVLGVEGFLKYIDPSNILDSTPFSNAATMFTLERSFYLADYRERMEYQLSRAIHPVAYRTYTMGYITTVLGVRASIPNAERILKSIYDFFIAYQKTEEGKALNKSYGFTGKFGE